MYRQYPFKVEMNELEQGHWKGSPLGFLVWFDARVLNYKSESALICCKQQIISGAG